MEQCYAQVEKGYLAIVFACEGFEYSMAITLPQYNQIKSHGKLSSRNHLYLHQNILNV